MKNSGNEKLINFYLNQYSEIIANASNTFYKLQQIFRIRKEENQYFFPLFNKYQPMRQ